MNKLKKSIKAIIISICAVVVLAGSIVGAVLANKDKPVNEMPNSASNVSVCNLTDEQKLLSKKINDSVTSKNTTVSKYDYSKFYFENDSQVDFDLVEAIYENYFTYKTVYGKTIYVRSHEADGKIYFKELFEALNVVEEREFELVFESNENYAYGAYGYQDAEGYIAKRVVVDLTDVSNIKILKEFEARAETFDDLASEIVLNKSIILKTSYFVNIERNFNSMLDVQIYDYNCNLLDNVSGFGSFDYKSFEDNCFYYVVGNDVCVGSFVNDEFKVYSLEENNESLYNYTISENYTFIEKISLADIEDLDAVDGKVYDYYYVDMNTGDIQEIELEDGYVKATFSSESLNGYYFVYMQKANVYSTDFEENGLMVYYKADGEVVLKYLTDTIEEKVIFIQNNNFVTKYSVYTFEKSVLAKKVKTFGENAKIQNVLVNNSTYVVFDGRLYYVYDINGDKVFEQGMSLICSYGNGIYYAIEQDELYLMNVNSKTISKVANFANDETQYNMISIMYGGGYYFTKNVDDNNYSMFDYNQNLVYNNVTSFEIIDKNTSYVNIVLKNGQKVSIDLNSLVYSIEGVSTDTSEPIETYASSSGTNWSATGGKDETNKHSWGMLTASNGKYASSGKFVWAGSGFVVSMVGDSTATFSFNYNTGTVSITNTFAITRVKKNVAEHNSSNQTHSIILDVDYHYNIVVNQWDDHVGDLRGMEDVSLDDVYSFVYDYILDSSKDYAEANNASNYKENSSYETVRYGGSFTLSANLTCIGGRLSGYSALVISGNSPTFTASLSSGSNSLPAAKLYTSHKRVDWKTYAVYTPNTYTVSYDYKGGSAGSKAPTAFTYGVAGGSGDKEISNPTKLGYTFTGWSISGMSNNCTHWWGGTSHGTGTSASSVTATTGYLNLTATHNGTVTFTANWRANKYKIIYNLNDTTKIDNITYSASLGTNKPVDMEYGVAGGPDDEAISNPTRLGFTFTGWDISGMSSDCTHYWGGKDRGKVTTASKVKDDFGFLNLTSVDGGEVTFKANWTANTYSIDYRLNDGGDGSAHYGTYYPASFSFGTPQTISNPKRTGYTFTGWSISEMTIDCEHYWGGSAQGKGATASSIKATASFKNLRSNGSASVVFLANWSANTYKVTFDMNNPNGVTNDISSFSDETLTYNTAKLFTTVPTKTGYIFSHWNVSNMDEKSSVTGDKIIHKHRASTSESWTDVEGTSVNNLTLPRQVMNLHSTGGTVKFTAQWTPITYNLTYDANSGVFNSDTNNPTKATYDQSFTITTPIRHGYNFTSWTVKVGSAAGTSQTLSALYPNTADYSFINLTTTKDVTVKFTANWSPVVYKINFVYNNPTKTNDSTTATFASWKNIANPTRMGYIFDYWEITGTSACGHTSSCACFTSADGGQCSHYYNNSNSDSGATRFRGESLASCKATYYKNLHCVKDGTVTFTAHWIKKTYKVINAGALYGATISTEYPKYDDVFSMTATTSAPTGYHFNGWSITGANNKDENTSETVTHIYGTTSSPSTTFTGTSKTVGKTVMYFKNLSSNNWVDDNSTAAVVTITPVWEPNTYTITFDMNNPNRVTTDITQKSNITATYDVAYNIANPTKAGYTFKGWALSGLTTESDCYHYYGNSSTSMTLFVADPSGAYKDSETAQYILLKSTYYKNLRSGAGNALLKAYWQANTYTITYHYIPASFNVANYNASQLFTHINIPKTMTSTKTVQVVYDTKYKALDAKNSLGEVVFALPVGLKFKLWTISASTLSANTQLAKYNSSNVVVTNQSDSILPNEERIYGPGKDSDGTLNWKHYASDIHLYACYDLAGINLRYYGPSAASGKNDLSKYSNLPAANTNVKYTEFIRFADYTKVVDGINLMGWMISADYFSVGQLTEHSVTIFEYKGGQYIAYQGSPAYWNYTNVDAYSYEDPTYFLYAVYSDDYSGSTHALDFTYYDNSSGSLGAHFSSKFYSVKGEDDSITSVKIPRIYNDGLHGWLPVEFIDSDAFSHYEYLTTAIWFDSIREIGGFAFEECTRLSTFTLNEGLSVINVYAFYGCSTITSLSMPSTLRIIDEDAFDGCTNVSSLSLNEGLLTISHYAFYNLSKVTSLSLPSTLVGEIGEYAFSYIQMTSVTIPKGVTTLGYACFYQCTKLATVTFATGSALKSIEGSAFNRTAITTISLPNSVTSIGNYAFYICSKLATVTLPDSLTTLGNSVFYDCSALTAVTIPKGLTSIPANTFYGCAKLAAVTIYNGITSIGDTAFYGCSSLTTLTIPNSVTSIGKSALSGCSKLATLSIPFVGKTAATTTASEYIIGYIFGASGATNNSSYVPTTLKTIYVTNDTSINANAFNGCANLTHLYINKGVTSIGQNAFNGCTALVELSLPFVGTSKTETTNCYLGYFFGQTSASSTTTSVPSTLKTVHITNATFVGDYAFYYAPVTTVNLNEGITEIKTYAFASSGVTSITLPKTVTKIGTAAFLNATALASANFNDGLTSIGASAFKASKIAKAVIPQSVTSIGANAFENCASLTTIVLFDGVTSIGDYAFSGTAVTSIKIPKTVTTVASRLFYNCKSLSSVTLHDSITSIGIGSFYVTPALTSITLPNSLTTISDFAFEKSGLTSIYIPDSVTTLAREAFDGCASLSSVRLSNNIATIGYEAFMGTAITRIEIPASVTNIQYRAFKNCTALVEILCFGAVATFGIATETPFAGCEVIDYFYYGGSSTTFYSNISGYNESHLFKNSRYQEMTYVYNFDHMQFTYHDGYYSFKAKGTIASGDSMVIPATYNDGVHGRYHVKVIEEKAFESQTAMTSVNLSSSVEYIYDRAFYNCTALTTANIPSSVSYIGGYAFYGCAAITSILTIPAQVVHIEDYTFYNCQKAGFKFAANAQCEYIGIYAFYYASYNAASANRYLMTIPSDVEYIGAHAFRTAKYMFTGELKIPAGLLYMGRGAFYDCDYITMVSIPTSLDSIEEYTFFSCANLSVVYIPNTVKSIAGRDYSTAPFYSAGPNYDSAPSLSIYLQGNGPLSGWGSYWNNTTSGKKANVFYNYSKMPHGTITQLNTAKPLVQDADGIFKVDLTSKLTSTTAAGLKITADYFVNVRFEYMIYGSDNAVDMCIELNGSTYPVSLKGSRTTTYQYYSVLLAKDEYLKIMINNSSCSTVACGLYIKNLRIEPIEKYGSYDFSKSGNVLTSTNNGVHNSESGFTYYATEHCELSFGYRNYSQSSYDYIVGYLNGTSKISGYQSSSSYKSYSVTMKPGDYFSIYFKKNGSTNSYDDKGYVQYFYVAMIQEWSFDELNYTSLTGYSNAAYSNAKVGEAFDIIGQWTNLSVTTVNGWEVLYKRIKTTKYNAQMRFVLFNHNGISNCNSGDLASSSKTLVGPYMQVTTSTPGNGDNISTSVAYGCFLPDMYKISIVTLTIPTPGSYYLAFNMGGIADGQTVELDLYCLDYLGVEVYSISTYTYPDSAFDNWTSNAASTSGYGTYHDRSYDATTYHSTVKSGDYFFRSGNKGVQTSISTTKYVAPADGLVSFNYKVESETGHDTFHLYLNNATAPILIRTGYVSGSYYVSVKKGDILKFVFRKDVSVDKGIDAVEITNFKFKKTFVFNDDGDGTYSSTNAGVQNSECVYVVHTGVSPSTYDGLYPSPKTSGTASINLSFSRELIHDKVEIYDDKGNLLFTSRGMTSTSKNLSFSVSGSSGPICFIIKYIKDGSIDTGTDLVSIDKIQLTLS